MGKKEIRIIENLSEGAKYDANEVLLFQNDVESVLKSLPESPTFDLVISSPPYNIGKPYEKKQPLSDYMAWQERVLIEIDKRMKPNGSIC